MIHTFLMAQLSDPTRLDRGQTVLKDKTEFSISLSLQEIELMSEISFKALVHKKEISTTLRYLNKLKERHTKVMHISHNELKMADYLTPNGITNSEAKFLFNARTRMLDVRSNFPGKHSDTLCPLCDDANDTQEHLLMCMELAMAGTAVTNLPNYEELFEESLDAKVYISRLLKEKMSQRKKILVS